MFCTNCGQYIGEGKAFCKYCGAPVARVEEKPARLAEGPVSPSSGPTESTLAPPPPPRARRGLVAGVVAAVIVVLAGAGVGSYFAFFRGEEQDDLAGGTASTVVAADGMSTMTTSVLSTSAPETLTTLAGGVTTQTVPALTNSSQIGATTTTLGSSTGSSTTDVSEDPVEVYLMASGRVVSELEYDDTRIPELAKVINDTIPKVPQGVRTELVAMLKGLDRMSAEMREMLVPPPFTQAHYWLGEAVIHMTGRVQATIKGVEAVWAAGKVDAKANGFFEQGRKERDAYREAISKYYENLPLE